jgi:DNA-binding CsgD family transcriptional regulator
MISTGSLEPVGDGQPQNEPVVGWRVWVVAENRLWSIGKDASWQAGENQAVCLAGRDHEAPAQSCHCGYWSLKDPLAALYMALQVGSTPRMVPGSLSVDANRMVAVGLILGYGALAVHGMQGFRSAMASVLCLFADAPSAAEPEHVDRRRAVAEEYGVPCPTLAGAASIGLLNEFGVEDAALDQLKQWLKAGRPLAFPQATGASTAPPPKTAPAIPLTEREWQIARLAARGMSSKEIASEVMITPRAVDFHLYRIIEKTGCSVRSNLTHWVKRNDV